MGRKIIGKKFRLPLMLIAAGLVLLLVGNVFFKNGEPQKEIQSENTIQGEVSYTLEQEIQQLVCAIPGVKDAYVVITYENSGEKVIEKDEKVQSDKTHEEDGAGGNRVVESQQQEAETVYVEDGQGNKYPFVKTETYGTVQGVAVVIRGTYDESIREKIVRMLEVLLDVPTHKVQVIF